MDPVSLIFSVVLVVMAIILSVVGVQLVLVLAEVRVTLRKFNQTIGKVEGKVNAIIAPLQQLGGAASGFQAGSKALEAFVDWLDKRRESEHKRDKDK